MTAHQKRALVTGGAGLIGSHVADQLQREGWTVRVLDNLEPQTHRKGKPAWIAKDVQFIEGDVRDRETMTVALQGIDVVFVTGGIHAVIFGDRDAPDVEKVHAFLGTAGLGARALMTRLFWDRA